MENTMGMVAWLMALSAKTAPKTRGQDFLEIKVLEGKDIFDVADELDRLAPLTGKKFFQINAESIRKSDALLLLSLVSPLAGGLDCGDCGFQRCADRKKDGQELKKPLCAWRLLDLGIALGSAVKTASLFNADNRIMYSVGVAAKSLGLSEGEVSVGVPISATSKNIYFDIKPKG